MLFQAKRFATAAGLALLAHEELGRYRILLRLWERAAAGQDVTADDVERECRDHVAKQRAGQLGLTYHIDRDSQYAKVLQARNAAFRTDAFQKLDAEVRAIDDRLAKRQPAARHERRQDAFYVDLSDDGTRWMRPSDLSRTDCAKALRDAANDYAPQRDRVL